MRLWMVMTTSAWLAGAAVAQDTGTLTLYTKGQFVGSSLSITRPTSKMVPMGVKSILITPGTVWELCSGNTFTGCERFSESRASMVRTVRSARPVAAPIAQSVNLPFNETQSPSGLSLRGLASEYFVAPAEAGERIEIAGKGAEAEDRAAREFCRRHGWRTSAY